MDVSDGLAGDLAKLCAASEVSAAIDAQSIPLSAPARDLLSRGAACIESIVSGGDDYEVLCTIPENRFEAFAQAAILAGVPVTSIGTILAGIGVPRFIDGQGAEIALPRLSYSHF
jgi:thiamine-monophosphate kinase